MDWEGEGVKLKIVLGCFFFLFFFFFFIFNEQYKICSMLWPCLRRYIIQNSSVLFRKIINKTFKKSTYCIMPTVTAKTSLYIRLNPQTGTTLFANALNYVKSFPL